MHNRLPVFWRRGFGHPKTVPDRFQVRSFSVPKRCKFLDAAKCTCNAALKVVPGSKMGSQNRYPWWYTPQKVWSRIRLPYLPRFLDSQSASDTPNWPSKTLPRPLSGGTVRVLVHGCTPMTSACICTTVQETTEERRGTEHEMNLPNA